MCYDVSSLLPSRQIRRITELSPQIPLRMRGTLLITKKKLLVTLIFEESHLDNEHCQDKNLHQYLTNDLSLLIFYLCHGNGLDFYSIFGFINYSG